MYYFIINPVSSSGTAEKTWENLEPIVKERQLEYRVHILQSAEDAEIITEAITSGMDDNINIIVLGGDGTLNKVLQGIHDFSKVTLSCIKVGSGNDFARNMSFPKDPVTALTKILDNPSVKDLDYGVIKYKTADGSDHEKRFLISSGVGYDADICQEANNSRLKKALNKLHIGKLVYVLIGIKQIFSRLCTPAVITMDDKVLKIPSLFFCVGMIHQFEGGGVPFCPDADPCDGLLEVCAAQKIAKPKLMLAVILVYLKKHTMFKKINTYRCKKLTIEVITPRWMHTDGEVSTKVKKAELHCEKGLKILY